VELVVIVDVVVGVVELVVLGMLAVVEVVVLLDVVLLEVVEVADVLVDAVTVNLCPWMLKLLVSDPALPKLCHTTTKFPAPSPVTAGKAWEPVVYVFTWNSPPTGVPELS
jgi:hypothetical protein